MISPSMKCVAVSPGGIELRQCIDDAEVKALAIRLGVYSQILAGVRLNRTSAAICRDGNTLYAVVLISGCDDPKDNGWVALSTSPAGPEEVDLLVRVVRAIVAPTHERLWQSRPSRQN